MPQDAAAPRSFSVLLVEDAAANALLFRTILERAGLSVSLAEDGRSAVTMAGAAPIDLILMDLGLPILGGVDAAREMREAGVAAPILALTAEDDPAVRRACEAAGMNGYIEKPVRPQALLAAVEAVAADTRV